jgi:hypothetical protein
MNVTQAVLEATTDTFDSGNLSPTFHEIGVALLFGPGTDPAQELTPIVEKLIHDCMRSIKNRLAEIGIRAVPVSEVFYREPDDFTWGAARQMPASLLEAYRCLPKGRVPAFGIVKIQGGNGWLWKADTYAYHQTEVVRARNYQQKLASFVQRGWLEAGEVERLSPAEFMRLTGRN